MAHEIGTILPDLGNRLRLEPSFRADNPDALIASARKATEVGWDCLRIGWKSDAVSPYEPRAHIAEIARWMIQARDALGSAVMLGVDYHHRLSIAEAASFCQKMPRGTLDFLEEPIRDETPEAHARSFGTVR